MRRRLAALFLSLCLIIGILPVTVFANPTTYEYEIQAVIADEDGRWVSTNALPSKDFSGTTDSGSSYNEDWQWTPTGGGYTITSEADTHVNAFGKLKHPTALWEYDSDEYKFIGIGQNSYSTTPAYNISETNLNSSYLFEKLSFSFSTRTGVRTYIFQQQVPEPEKPSVDSLQKERLTAEPSGVDLDLEGVTVTYDEAVVIPVDGAVTLLYKLTVTGDEGANFVITDAGATLVGSDCAATQDGDTMSGTIPEGGSAIVYVTKTFDADDISDGNLSNTASVAPDEGSEGPGGSDTETTPATPETPKPSVDGLQKERLTEAPSGVDLNLNGATVNYENTVVIPVDGTVTLLYKLTVTGDEGAKFVITDAGATLVGSDCAATQNGDTISGTIPEGGSAIVYVTKTFDADDIESGNLSNTASVAPGEGSEGPGGSDTETTPATPETPEPPEEDLSIEKAVNVEAGAKVDVGDELTYTITVTNNGESTAEDIVVTDTMWGDSVTEITVGSDTFDVSDGSYTIDSLAPGANWTCTYTYTVQDTDTTITNTAGLGDGSEPDDEDEVTVEVDEDSRIITIKVADIVAYTGGPVNSGIVDEDGNFVSETSSGLPKPGLHILLPDWVNEKHIDGTDLSNILTFSYSGSDGQGNPIERTWTLRYVGVYSTNPLRYVYSLEPTGDAPEVRIEYFAPGSSEPVFDDQIDFSDTSVNQQFTMAIYPGLINQSEVKAHLTIDGETYDLTTKAETGTLTVIAIVEDEDAITGDTVLSGVPTEGTKFYVNDTEVEIDVSRVELLVDSVSDSEEFIAQIEGDAISKVDGLRNPAAESYYLDLVDSENGNAKVSIDGSITISWPMPEKADPDGTFKVIHYTDMDRTDSEADFNHHEVIDADVVDGHVEFTTSSFSPFVLVYENAEEEPDDGEITDFAKELVTSAAAYRTFDLPVPEFHRGTVYVDKYDGVTLLYAITVEGTAGTRYVVTDQGARWIGGDGLTDTIGADGKNVIYVTKSFSWRDIRNSDGWLCNTAHVAYGDGTTPPTGTDFVETPVVIDDWDWPIDDPDWDDGISSGWLNTKDHFGYLVGYDDGTIRPNANITRAEVATIFFRLLTDETRAAFWSETNPYSDVTAGDWFNNAVSTLSSMGILDGYKDGTFRPNAPISRAEFTAIATRFFDYTAKYSGAFLDVSYRSWYADSVQAAVNMGLVNGYADNTFRPENSITRAEACAIFNRTLHRAPDKDHLLPEREMITWPDNSAHAWYYEDIQEATNSHTYEWIGDMENWLEKLPERNWEALEQ